MVNLDCLKFSDSLELKSFFAGHLHESSSVDHRMSSLVILVGKQTLQFRIFWKRDEIFFFTFFFIFFI